MPELASFLFVLSACAGFIGRGARFRSSGWNWTCRAHFTRARSGNGRPRRAYVDAPFRPEQTRNIVFRATWPGKTSRYWRGRFIIGTFCPVMPPKNIIRSGSTYLGRSNSVTSSRYGRGQTKVFCASTNVVSNETANLTGRTLTRSLW